MKTFALLTSIFLLTGNAFADNQLTKECTFSIGPTVALKATYNTDGSNITDGKINILSADGVLITQLDMKKVAIQSTHTLDGKPETARMQITPDANLPDIQALVLYGNLSQDSVSSALILSPNAMGSMMIGTCSTTSK